MELFGNVRRESKYNCTRISDYDLLGQYVEAWADGRGHTTLVILGRPGILKSSVLRDVLGQRKHLYVEGFTGPLALYRDLYLNLNVPVALDDVKITENLRPILQPLWDNYPVHTIRWATAKPPKVYVDGRDDDRIVVKEDGDEDEDWDDGPEASDGETEGGIITLPSQFKTTSQCCVLTNSIDRLSQMPALLDRAYIIEFDPSVSDLLDRCRHFVDADVWAWAKRHEVLLPDLSVRDLVQAGTDKKMGMPWEKLLMGRYFDPRSNLGAYLKVLSSMPHASGDERVDRWIEMTEKDRSVYYKVQKAYRKQFPAPNLPRGRSAKARKEKAAKVAKSQKKEASK